VEENRGKEGKEREPAAPLVKRWRVEKKGHVLPLSSQKEKERIVERQVKATRDGQKRRRGRIRGWVSRVEEKKGSRMIVGPALQNEVDALLRKPGTDANNKGNDLRRRA